jgi:DNA invertase Pin-like site-specific DNA recombinase
LVYKIEFIRVTAWKPLALAMGRKCRLLLLHRAVIYIRTSSETQGGKSSPSEQEDDCQTLAKEKGLQVVRIYRDVEKYRVGNRLVEPSGSCSDRPGLLAMIKDDQ